MFPLSEHIFFALRVFMICQWLGARHFARAAEGSYNEVKALQDYLLSDYNKLARPVYNQSDTVYVAVVLTLDNLQEVDERAQTLTFLVIIQYIWQDALMVWNPADVSGITNLLLPPDSLWKPDFLAVNRIADLAQPEMSTAALNVRFDGRVWASTRQQFKVSCQMNMPLYPFDEHNCTISLSNFVYYEDEVNYVYISATVLKDAFSNNSEFDVTAFTAATINLPVDDTGKLVPFVIVQLNIRRLPEFVIYTILLPISILSLISVVPYILPADSEKKADIQVSMMLSFSVFMLLIAGSIPPSTILPYVALLLVGMMGLNCFGIFINLILLRLISLAEKLPPKTFMKIFKVIGYCVCLPPPAEHRTIKVTPIPTQSVNDAEDATSTKPGNTATTSIEPVLKDLKEIQGHIQQSTEENRARKYWFHVASVVDRFLLILVTVLVAAMNWFLYKGSV